MRGISDWCRSSGRRQLQAQLAELRRAELESRDGDLAGNLGVGRFDQVVFAERQLCLVNSGPELLQNRRRPRGQLGPPSSEAFTNASQTGSPCASRSASAGS